MVLVQFEDDGSTEWLQSEDFDVKVVQQRMGSIKRKRTGEDADSDSSDDGTNGKRPKVRLPMVSLKRQSSDEECELREQLVQAYIDMLTLGLTQGTSGNLS